MIRVLVVDDHPLVRTGLESLLGLERGISAVGATDSGRHLERVVERCQPDVVLVGGGLREGDVVGVCRRVKSRDGAPNVLLYPARTSTHLVAAALVAGAEGIISGRAPTTEVYEAIRRVASGQRFAPDIHEAAVFVAGAGLAPRAYNVLIEVLSGSTVEEACRLAGVSHEHADDYVAQICDGLLAPGAGPEHLPRSGAPAVVPIERPAHAFTKRGLLVSASLSLPFFLSIAIGVTLGVTLGSAEVGAAIAGVVIGALLWWRHFRWTRWRA